MTWTAPKITRDDPPLVAGERAMLDGWLDFHRQTLLWKCAGLTAGELARRSTEPSGLCLLGLVRHMAEVERSWFRHGFAREPIGNLYCTDDAPGGGLRRRGPGRGRAGFRHVPPGGRACRAAVDGRALDETFHQPRRQRDVCLRWIYLHMIEEYARHNGHADLIRERIDGAVGD